MKLLDIYEGYDPSYLIIRVTKWFWLQQIWRGSLARGWYQPTNGKTAHGKTLGFLNRHAFEFHRVKQGTSVPNEGDENG